MLGKNKVLPLVDFLAIEAGWDDGPDIALKVAGAQRDADWERVKPLLETLRILADPASYSTDAGEDKALLLQPFYVAKVVLDRLVPKP